MQETKETQVQSLAWEDTLEKEMTTHSSISCLKNSMNREAWQAKSMEQQRVGHGRAQTCMHSYICTITCSFVVPFIILKRSLRESWKEQKQKSECLNFHGTERVYTFENIYFFLKFYFIFKLYIIVLVLPNIKMNPSQVYMCSPS